MTTDPLATLERLAFDCRARVSGPPTWAEVVESCARLRLGASFVNAATAAGLGVDSVELTIEDHWPSDVDEALKRLGLFDKYSPTTVHGVLAHLSHAQLAGLENNVKGVDFELTSVDRINHGQMQHVPGGASHAHLAGTLNQPGWDAIGTLHGHQVSYMQMKATDNWEVLAHHLSRYPQYPDIVTTHEVATEAARRGLDAGHVFDTGITDASLTEHVDVPLSHIDAFHMLHEVVPETAFVVILAFAIRKLRRGEDRQAVAQWVKEQAAVAGIANLAGLVVQVATGTVVFRVPVTIGTRFVAARGKVASQVAARMNRMRCELEALRQSLSPHAIG